MPAGLEAIRTAFATVYHARYNLAVWPVPRSRADQLPRPLAWARPRPCRWPAPPAAATLRPSARAHRLARFADGTVEAVVYDRYALVPGDRIEGPAIIEERESTTIVPPGDIVRVDETLNLRIAIASPPRSRRW